MSSTPKMFDRITRSIVRPIISLGSLAVWCAFIYFDVSYPEEFKWLVLATNIEWFSERAIVRLFKDKT